MSMRKKCLTNFSLLRLDVEKLWRGCGEAVKKREFLSSGWLTSHVKPQYVGHQVGILLINESFNSHRLSVKWKRGKREYGTDGKDGTGGNIYAISESSSVCPVFSVCSVLSLRFPHG
jgi:hypothetical protein